jgi:hypothetical protein
MVSVFSQTRFRPGRQKANRPSRLSVEQLEKRELLAAFSPGNLVVLRSGDGTGYRDTAALYLDEYVAGTGTVVQSAAIPNNQTVGGPGNQPITIDSSAAAGNGQLNRAYDGSVLTFGGVDAGVNSTTATGSADRVLAVAGNDPADPNFLDTTTHGQFYVGDDNRGAVAESATGPFWSFGHPNQAGGAVSQGVHYFPTTGPSIGTQVSAGGNIRGATIGFDNRLYFSTAGSTSTGLAGIYTLPQALPTTPTPASDVPVVKALFTASKLGGIYLADVNGTGVLSDGDRLYFIDDGTVGGAGSGGLYVSTYNKLYPGNHWSTAVRLGDGLIDPQPTPQATAQLRGLAGTVISSTETDLYVTEFDNVAGNNSYILKFTDTGLGVDVASASESGNTVTITTAIPNQFTTGQTVVIDGVGASTGVGALTSGYNGSWTVTVIDSTHFTYTDTNASGLATVVNQGAADAAVSPAIVATLADGTTVASDGHAYAAQGIRGVAFAPVAPTSVGLTFSPDNPEPPGTPVTFTATLTNAQVTPTGMVTFIDQNTGTVLGQAPIQSGSATFTTVLVGNHYVSAYYAGGGPTALASARSNTVQVLEAGSSASLAAMSTDLGVAAVGRQVRLSATVSDNNTGTDTPTGTVSFYLGGTNLTNLLGTSTLTGPISTVTVTNGGSGYSATPTVTITDPTGSGAVATATVAGGVITGISITNPGSGYTRPTVVITDATGSGATALVTASFAANLSTAFTTIDTQNLFAIYNGNDTFASSTDTTSVATDANATAVITSSANNVPVGSTTTYTATLVGNATLGVPAGAVQFYQDGAPIGPNVAIATATEAGTTVTITTTAAHGLSTGQLVTISGVSIGSTTANLYNGVFTITVTGANTFTYSLPITDLAAGSGGAAFLPLTLTPGNNNTASASLTSPTLTAGSHLVTVSFATTGPSNPYLNFALDTITATHGVAFIETAQQAFHPGNLVAVQRGDGTVNLGSSGYLVFLDEYTPSGTLVQRIALPNADSATGHALLLSGQNGAEGLLNRSADGYSLTLSGYDVPVGLQFVTSTFPFQYPRTIALVDGSGNVDTSTAISTDPSSSIPYNPLDVVTNDGGEFWLVSNLPTGDTTESGIEYVGSLGATAATQIGPAGTHGTSLVIAGGQLYAASTNNDGSGNPVGVWQVGTGLPTTTATLAGLPGLAAAYQAAFPNAQDPKQLLFLNHLDGSSNNPDTLYIADQSNGLLKFYFDGTTWVFGNGSPTNPFGQKLLDSGGVTGVVGSVVNPGPNATFQLFVTGSNVQGQNPNQIAAFSDTNAYNGGFARGPFSLVAFVGATGTPPSPNGNMNFAGLAFVPGYHTSIQLTSSLNPATAGQSVTFTAHVTAPTGTPTGVVTFVDGTTVLGTGTLDGSGTATFTTSTLSVGDHPIMAFYNGDVADGTSTSAVLTETILPADGGGAAPGGRGGHRMGFGKEGREAVFSALVHRLPAGGFGVIGTRQGETWETRSETTSPATPAGVISLNQGQHTNGSRVSFILPGAGTSTTADLTSGTGGHSLNGGQPVNAGTALPSGGGVDQVWGLLATRGRHGLSWWSLDDDADGSIG